MSDIESAEPLASEPTPSAGATETLVIPRFNWAAFLIPPIWGIANRQWWGVMFLPAWVFVDNMLRSESTLGAWTTAAGIGMAAVTVGLQAIYARTADGIALQRVTTRDQYERYIRHQRIWRVVAVFAFIGMAAWITTFIMTGGPLDRP